MLIYTYSPESEEGSDLFQIKIGLLTSKLCIALTKCNNHHLSQLRQYQKELQELFATHSQRVFRRVIYFKWSKRLEPIQRPFGRENAATSIAARFQHLPGTLSISFADFPETSAGTAGDPLAAANAFGVYHLNTTTTPHCRQSPPYHCGGSLIRR